MPETGWFQMKLKYWEQLRNAIVHEDNLVNNRLTWLITVEGFLIGGFLAFCASVVSNAHGLDNVDKLQEASRDFLWAFAVGVVIIFAFASHLCLVTGILVFAAIEQIKHVNDAWCCEYPSNADFPPMIGGLPRGRWPFSRERGYAKLALLSIPAALFVINTVIVVFIIWQAYVVLGARLTAVCAAVLYLAFFAYFGVVVYSHPQSKRKR